MIEFTQLMVSVKDVSEKCGVTPAAVSNWRARDPDFPLPYSETAAGSVWKAEDIAKYLTEKRNIYAIATGKLKHKRLAVVGRARTGKSFFTSRFVFDREKYCELFCGNGSDETVCPVHTRISEDFQESYAFHTDFNSVFKEDHLDDGTDIGDIKAKVTELTNKSYGMDNTEIMNEIKGVVTEINKIKKKISPQKDKPVKITIYIETFQRPGDFCQQLLRECGLGMIEVIDFPGVSGNVECSEIAKSDIYVFCLRSENSEDAETIEKIVDEIKADVATGKVMFLYKTDALILSKERYDAEKNKAHKGMKAFNDRFNKLRGSIISTDIDLLNPAEHCIVFPPMTDVEVSPPEEFFLSDVKEKLREAFIPKDTDGEFLEIASEYGDAAKELVIEIMKGIEPYKINNDSADSYTLDDFYTEKHDRVKTGDRQRLNKLLYYAYEGESRKIYNYFSGLSPEEYKQDWQRKIIKYLYEKLSNGIRTDRGLGLGTHPREEYPARTMLVEESILADKLLEVINAPIDYKTVGTYQEVLRDKANIQSASWDYVRCSDIDGDMILKLKLIKKCFIDKSVINRYCVDMILYRYIGGLRKLTQYDILRKMGYGEAECMELTEGFPF